MHEGRGVRVVTAGRVYKDAMLTKPLLLAVLAACGVPSTLATADPAEQPDEIEPPPEPPQKDQHFCCQNVDPKTKSGEGCLTIGKGQIDQCPELLYCAGSYAKHDGKTYCL
jgi:hypothetical protein